MGVLGLREDRDRPFVERLRASTPTCARPEPRHPHPPGRDPARDARCRCVDRRAHGLQEGELEDLLRAGVNGIWPAGIVFPRPTITSTSDRAEGSGCLRLRGLVRRHPRPPRRGPAADARSRCSCGRGAQLPLGRARSPAGALREPLEHVASVLPLVARETELAVELLQLLDVHPPMPTGDPREQLVHVVVGRSPGSSLMMNRHRQ